MTKANALWAVLLVNLLSVTLAGAYVALRAPEIRGLMAMSANDKPAPKPTASTKGGNAAAPGAKPSGAMPPPREALPPPRANDNDEVFEPTIEARALGPSAAPPTDEPPPPMLYPFQPVRRTFPDDKTIEVELLIQNKSQQFWRPATVTFRSPGYPRSEMFRIDTWRNNEIALVRYRFPKSELEFRLKDLRVVAVTGETLDTPAGSVAADQRISMLRTLDASRGGDRGLMAIMRGASAALATDQTAAPDPNLILDKLTLTIVGYEKVPDQWSPPFDTSTPERVEASKLLTEAHAKAIAIKRDLEKLGAMMADQGYQRTIAGEGGEAVLRINAAKVAFEEVALKANLALSRTRDAEVRKAQPALDSWADAVVQSLESAATQVKLVDPKFSIGGM